jgi:hypothetical protein
LGILCSLQTASSKSIVSRKHAALEYLSTVAREQHRPLPFGDEIKKDRKSEWHTANRSLMCHYMHHPYSCRNSDWFNGDDEDCECSPRHVKSTLRGRISGCSKRVVQDILKWIRHRIRDERTRSTEIRLISVLLESLNCGVSGVRN